jgi:hypothetical protein
MQGPGNLYGHIFEYSTELFANSNWHNSNAQNAVAFPFSQITDCVCDEKPFNAKLL